MKKIVTTITAGLGILCLGLLAGCTDALNPSLLEGDAGTGRALVRIGPRAAGARTLIPRDYGISYTLTFTQGGGAEKTVPITDAEAEVEVELEPGIWDLSVTGYVDETGDAGRICGRY
jgi:hypothetical protein